MSPFRELADQLGLGGEGLTLTRAGAQFVFDEQLTSAPKRAQFWHLLGVRLGLDRLTTSYRFRDERPTGTERIRNAYDQPSPYGDRVQYLLPRRSIEVAEVVSGARFIVEDWVDPELCICCLREVGKEWHVFAERDFQHVGFDRANLLENTRLSLFYDSYKPRPVETKYPWGRIRVHQTSHGIMMASRAILFPDYDYDASDSNGLLCVTGRNSFVVAELRTEEPDAMLADFRQTCMKVLQAESMPLSDRFIQLRRTSLELGGILFDDETKRDL